MNFNETYLYYFWFVICLFYSACAKYSIDVEDILFLIGGKRFCVKILLEDYCVSRSFYNFV